MAGEINGAGAYSSNRILGFRSAQTRRDGRIDGFFRMAGIDSYKLEDDQKLNKDEILNDQNKSNPRAQRLVALFESFATGVDKDAEGKETKYLTANDMDKFIAVTNNGLKDPQPATASSDAPFSIFNLQKYQ